MGSKKKNVATKGPKKNNNNNSQQHAYAAAQEFFTNKQKLQQKQQEEDDKFQLFSIRNSLATGALSSTMGGQQSKKIVSQANTTTTNDDGNNNEGKKMPAKKKNYHHPSLKKNALEFPPPPTSAAASSGKEQIDQMKATMGPTKYKQLKKNTQRLAKGEITGQHYIDESLKLFSEGILDDLFWSYIPPLLHSFPATNNNREQALSYMENLRFAQVLQQREYLQHSG